MMGGDVWEANLRFERSLCSPPNWHEFCKKHWHCVMSWLQAQIPPHTVNTILLLQQLWSCIHIIWGLSKLGSNLFGEISDVLEEEPTGNCLLLILFGLASADGDKFRGFCVFPPTTLLLLLSFCRLIKHSFPEFSAVTATTPTGWPKSNEAWGQESRHDGGNFPK